jgi:hypothetical protein
MMKAEPLPKVALVAAFTLLTALMTTTSIAATGYPMVCKGGGEMEATFSHVKSRGDFHNTSLLITFRKSRAAASGTEPAAGHCAWIDRPISADEPSSLAYSPGSGQDFYFKFRTDSWSLTETEDAGLEQIMHAMRRGEKFYIRCHREGTYFKVDSVGP